MKAYGFGKKVRIGSAFPFTDTGGTSSAGRPATARPLLLFVEPSCGVRVSHHDGRGTQPFSKLENTTHCAGGSAP
jgi:hypothetical protein